MFGYFFAPAFQPGTDIPPLTDKVIIITGSNGGLGYASLLHLLEHGKPARIYLCARTRAKYDKAMEGIKAAIPDSSITAAVKWLELDLSSLASVKSAATTFLEQENRLDILMNNAGIMAQPAALTTEGYEIQFGTNHVGHALLTKLLIPLIQKTAKDHPDASVRIINLTSEGHKFAPSPTGFVPEACKTDMSTYNTWSRYGQSKLANIYFTTELARRYPEILSVSIHPGGVATNLTDSFSGTFQKDHPWLAAMSLSLWGLVATQATQGSLNQTWAAVAPVKGKGSTASGSVKEIEQAGYYVPVAKAGGMSRYAQDKARALEQWEWTEGEFASLGY